MDDENDEVSAILGTSSSAKTMADGTLRVSIDIEPKDAINAFGLFGTPGSPVAMARIRESVALDHGRPGKNRLYGEYAKDLKLSSFFRTITVWEAVGTDIQYLEWVKRQACAVSGEFSEYHETGMRYCIPAHVRRVEHGSGTGIKPPYCAIPLTNLLHQKCHQEGDSALGDEEWWDKQRIKYVQKWCWETLKQKLTGEPDASWAEIHPGLLRDWAQEHDLLKYLPNSYKVFTDDGQDQSAGEA